MNKMFKNQIVQDGRVSVLLYGEIGDGEKCDSESVVAELMELAAAYSSIDVHINSKGGDVFAGIAIYNALRTVQADVTIYVDGIAASIAGVIALCGRPLYMNKYARLMLHRVSGGAYGNADELIRVADMCNDLEVSLAEIIAKRCGKETGEILSMFFDGTDHYLTAEQAMDMKLCDGIVDMVVPESVSLASVDDIYNFTNRLAEEPAQNKINMALIDELKKRPTFANMASEADMLAHITTLESQAAKVPELTNKVNELNEKLASATKAANLEFLNKAVAEGRITKEQIPTFENLMLSDAENTRKVIDSMPIKRSVKVEDVLKGVPGGENKFLNRSFDEIDKANELAELKRDYPELYQKKFNEKFGK